MVVDEKEVLRLDVEVLQVVLGVHQVQHFGGLLHVLQEHVAVDAGLAFFAAGAEAVPEAAVGQFGDDVEPAADQVVAVDRQQVRVADRLDALEGAEFLKGELRAGRVHDPQVAVDDLDRLEQPAGRLGLPDFAVPAAAEPFQEPVAGDRFSAGSDPDGHGKRSLRRGTAERMAGRTTGPGTPSSVTLTGGRSN